MEDHQNGCRLMIFSWQVCHRLGCRIICFRNVSSHPFAEFLSRYHFNIWLGEVSFCIILFSAVSWNWGYKRGNIGVHLFLSTIRPVWLLKIFAFLHLCCYSYSFLASINYDCYSLFDMNFKVNFFGGFWYLYPIYFNEMMMKYSWLINMGRIWSNIWHELKFSSKKRLVGGVLGNQVIQDKTVWS